MKKTFLIITTVLSFSVLRAQDHPYFINSGTVKGQWTQEINTVMNDVNVQRLLLEIAKEPQTKEYVNAAIQKSKITIDQLLKLKLIRAENNTYQISYLLFTKADQIRKREITNEQAKILADALLKRRTELETILKPYNLPEVDPRAVIYIILGCFSLDWDGLAITEERGYRVGDNDNTRTILFSEECVYEDDPAYSLLSRKEFYRGSHNSEYGMFTLTSFGDHESQPRMAFPDVLWQIESKTRQFSYPDTFKQKLRGLAEAMASETGEQAGQIMFLLRSGGKTFNQLKDSANMKAEKAKSLTELMAAAGYIKQKENKFLPCIPVLLLGDSAIVRQIRQIGLEELKKYFDAEYNHFYKQLSELTPYRYGIAQKDYFYFVWHDIFAAANRILVKAGLFADPYSIKYGGKGIIPAVFLSSLYKKP